MIPLMCYVVLGMFLTEVIEANSSCNDYVDEILRNLKEDKEYFHDPYAFPEKSFVIYKKFFLVNYTGEAKVYDGHIYGLASLHRDGDVIVDKNGKTHLKLYLGAGELKLICKGTVKFMGYGPHVDIDAVIPYVNMKLDIVPKANGTNPKIANFNIEDVRGTRVKVTGLGPLNFILNNYIKMIGTVFRKLVRNSVESRLQTFMQKKLKKYVIPEECLNEGYTL